MMALQEESLLFVAQMFCLRKFPLKVNSLSHLLTEVGS